MPSNTTSPLGLKFTVKTWTPIARRLEPFRGERLEALAAKLADVDAWTLYRWCRGISQPQGLYRAMLDRALSELDAGPQPEAQTAAA